jgi:hypothetical protein
MEVTRIERVARSLQSPAAGLGHAPPECALRVTIPVFPACQAGVSPSDPGRERAGDGSRTRRHRLGRPCPHHRGDTREHRASTEDRTRTASLQGPHATVALLLAHERAGSGSRIRLNHLGRMAPHHVGLTREEPLSGLEPELHPYHGCALPLRHSGQVPQRRIELRSPRYECGASPQCFRGGKSG